MEWREGIGGTSVEVLSRGEVRKLVTTDCTFNQLVISPFPGHPVVREDPERAPQRLVTSHLPTRTLNHRDAWSSWLQ